MWSQTYCETQVHFTADLKVVYRSTYRINNWQYYIIVTGYFNN